MKTIIIYTTKYGYTEDCVKEIEKNLEGEVSTLNISNKFKVNLEEFDKIIIGSPVYMGSIDKKISKFVNDYKDIILKKKYGLFVANGNVKETDRVFETSIPKEVLDKSLINTSFGGEFRFDKMKKFDKFIVNMVSKAEPSNSEPKKLDDNIKEFIKIINKG